MNELKQAQAELAAAIQDHSRMGEKVREYNDSVADSRKIIDLLVDEREAAERDLVRGKSTPAAVAAIDKKLKEAEEKLESFQRLLTFSKEELLSLDRQIVTARQAVANARFAGRCHRRCRRLRRRRQRWRRPRRAAAPGR